MLNITFLSLLACLYAVIQLKSTIEM